jgi:hypothetical protein
MTEELKTIIDFIRYGASRFAASGLTFGHGHDNALDEATQLVLHALHLPHDLKPAYGAARLVADEMKVVLDLFERRIRERKPACYLTGEAWFAELLFKCDERALVPRSPIAELILEGYEPWRNGRPLNRVLDLCTGGGCIAIASAHYLPDALVDGVDISTKALSLANENAERLLVADRVRFIESNLFAGIEGVRQDLLGHHLRREPRAGDRLRDRRLPAGHRDRPEDFRADLERRATGRSRHTSQRRERMKSRSCRRLSGPHHRHADRAADPQHRPALEGLREHRQSSSAPVMPTTPTGRNTASAIRAAAVARRRAKPPCAWPRR